MHINRLSAFALLIWLIVVLIGMIGFRSFNLEILFALGLIGLFVIYLYWSQDVKGNSCIYALRIPLIIGIILYSAVIIYKIYMSRMFIGLEEAPVTSRVLSIISLQGDLTGAILVILGLLCIFSACGWIALCKNR